MTFSFVDSNMADKDNEDQGVSFSFASFIRANWRPATDIP